MANLFEKTMSLCLEDKAVAPVVAGKKRTLTEKKQLLREQEENIDDELGIGEPEVDPFEAEMAEFEDTDEDMSDIEMGDIEDDIMVVIDPEKTEDDKVDSELQDMVDDAEGNAVSDEYIDQYVYQCPICGNSFFSGVEMKDEDECPVCGEFPSGFILDGQVAPAEDVAEEPADDEAKEEPEEDEAIEEPVDEEVVDEPADEAEEDVEDEEEKKESMSRNSMKKNATFSHRPSPKFQLDESTFNPYLTKFVRENYKNARSLRVTDAKANKDTLTLECKLTFKNGNSKKVEFVCENYTRKPQMMLKAKRANAFKSESYNGSTPFLFKCSMRGRTIRCEGMKYNFITKVNENKSAHVYGKYINESRKPSTHKRVK